MSETNSKYLTNGNLLARNVVYSLLGQAAPLLVAVFTIPFLIRGLGTERFGVLTIAWIVISYFSLFDLGLGRALTQLISEKIGLGKTDEITNLIRTASVMMILIGVFGTLLLVILAPWLVYNTLKLPSELQTETLHAFYLLSISIPIITSTAGFVGVLSSLQRFDLINMVRIPSGLFMFLGPLLILPFSKNLIYIIGILLLNRFATLVIHIWQCLNFVPILNKQGKYFDKGLMKPLLGFGGWMTISNIISPLMLYIDRFMIGSVLSITAVTYYTTPYEVITKFGIIPGAIVSVLFPAFSSSFHQDKAKTVKLYDRGLKYIFITLFPITLIIITFPKQLLYCWLGSDFSKESSIVLQILTIGMLFNGFAQIPAAFIQGIGKPKMMAKVHLIELPIYLLMLQWFLPRYGINGAALTWTIRIIFDTLVLYKISQKYLLHKNIFWKTLLFSSTFPLILYFLSSIYEISFSIKFIAILFIVFMYMISIWKYHIDEKEKKIINQIFRNIKNHIYCRQ